MQRLLTDSALSFLYWAQSLDYPSSLQLVPARDTIHLSTLMRATLALDLINWGEGKFITSLLICCLMEENHLHTPEPAHSLHGGTCLSFQNPRSESRGIRSHCSLPLLHGQLQASLGCMRTCLKISNETKPQARAREVELLFFL